MRRAYVLPLLLACAAFAEAHQGQGAPNDEDLSIQAFIQQVEDALAAPGHAAWADLLSPNADHAGALAFYQGHVPREVTRAVVRERDRLPLEGALPGDGYRLMVDAFLETGTRGRIHTWVLDIRKPRGSDELQPWRLIATESLASIEGLHRLALSTDKQYAVRNLVLRSVDLELRLATGDVFVVDTTDGVTGVVLLGDGTMSFAPAPPEERGQVRLFTGSETILTPFTAAYIRLNPFEFDVQLRPQLTAPVPVDARTLRRAQQVFDDEAGKSYSLDLRDLSRDTWSLLPQIGDFLAEIRTRRFSTLTFARAMNEAEDVTLFHRARGRNIASYASEMKLSSRGRFYNEDDLVEYDVLDYAINVAFSPARQWLDGHARVKVRVKAFALAALTLRLAEDMNVTSVTSDRLGRLMFLRVRNQNNVVINLPAPVARGTELTLSVTYGGPIRSQSIDQESLGVVQIGRSQRVDDLPYVPPEPNWLFSNRSQWYPQNQVSDYATATLHFTVPADYTVVASGVETIESPLIASTAPNGTPGDLTYVFEATQPIRYIGVVISRFTRVDRASVALDVSGERNTVMLAVEANRRQQERGRDILNTSAEILRFYATILDDAPFEAFTVAMVEHERPGGHSPAYFAVLNNPLPLSTFAHRQDPAAFSGFPEFYIAHEIAHQWWGQAVGWKNYHEQWLSEGFAQYFAALYAKERRGDTAFRDVMRQFRRWAMDHSDQGPVYLGYRLGHIRNDSRIFRAIAYNKGAAVLHMLRRWVGDEAFFRGLRRYYSENRFAKAGTEDLQRAFEEESGESLERFFERWIYESGLPRIRYSTSVDREQVVVRFEQLGDTYDVPVTVTLNYTDRAVEHVVLIAADVVERRFPLIGTLRSVEVNGDHAALGAFERR